MKAQKKNKLFEWVSSAYEGPSYSGLIEFDQALTHINPDEETRLRELFEVLIKGRGESNTQDSKEFPSNFDQ